MKRFFSKLKYVVVIVLVGMVSGFYVVFDLIGVSYVIYGDVNFYVLVVNQVIIVDKNWYVNLIFGVI